MSRNPMNQEKSRTPRSAFRHAASALRAVLTLLLVLLAGIVSVFLGGGVVDPEDIWIMGWLAALIALAAWRGFRKTK